MEPTGASTRPARREWAWLAAILCVALALRALDLTDPWGSRGFRSAFGAYSSGPLAKSMAEDGLLAEGLMPYFSRVRLADGSYEVAWYAHHPAGSVAVTAAFMAVLGTGEWAARAPWILASLWAVVAAFLLLRDLYGGRAAAIGAWFLAVVPLAASHGSVVWVDHALLALSALCFRRYARWLRDGRARHLGLAALYVAAGGLLDWPMHLTVAAIGAHAAALLVARRRALRALLPLLALPAASAATVLLHYVHMHAVMGAEATAEDAGGTASFLLRFPDGFAAWLRVQARHLARLLTEPLLAVVAIAFARLCVRGARGAARAWDGLALALLLPGVLYVALFPARSINHDFFWEIGLLGFAALVGTELDLGWRAAAARSRPLAAALAVAAGLGASALCAQRVVASWRAGRDDLPRALARHPIVAPAVSDPDAVVLAAAGEAQLLAWYSEAPILGPVTSPQDLEHVQAGVLARIEPERPVYLILTATGFREQRALYESLHARGVPSQRGEVDAQNLPPLAFELFRLR